MSRPTSAASSTTSSARQRNKTPTPSSPALYTTAEQSVETPDFTPRPKSKRAKKRARNRARRGDAFPHEPDHPADPRHLSHGRDELYHHRNLSDASIESASLLDHRGHPYMRARRPSAAVGEGNSNSNLRSRFSSATSVNNGKQPRGIGRQRDGEGDDFSSGSSPESQHEDEHDETTHLLPKDPNRSRFASSPTKYRISPGLFPPGDRLSNRPAVGSSLGQLVNFPPSVPGSPTPERRTLLGYGSSGSPYTSGLGVGDTVIDIEGMEDNHSNPPSPTARPRTSNRHTSVEEDVCFPVDEPLMDDASTTHGGEVPSENVRPRARGWPDLNVLEEWAREEKEQTRREGIRARRVSEEVLVGGRLRPRGTWHREEEDAPYRFTYFNEEFASTIHSHTISELLQPGQTFEELFRPEPRAESPEDESDWDRATPNMERDSRKGSKFSVNGPGSNNNGVNPVDEATFKQNERLDHTAFPGETATQRPTFWLDVLSPTDQEMKVIAKAFGIHPLTVEDILLQEAREKVELFRTYYLVAYKTFEQDPSSENYLDPVNVYAVVFREGILTFHFSLIPHCANVRRRIRQLKDYISVSADWISYALIDDITDAFAPLIQSIETEAEILDHSILQLHNAPLASSSSSRSSVREKSIYSSSGQEVDVGDILRQIGDCRKKVMGLYRLLGNKADVIKGFSKRCNERWSIAPRSEIGLYLGDIQDHIVTMVSNLSHYEKILSRAFSNYLAQINLKMNERAEETADVLGRLTVLGTIVLPMNIITGLWGMNVLVPGQDKEGLSWFFGITGCLVAFGIMCYFIAKRVYGIV